MMRNIIFTTSRSGPFVGCCNSCVATVAKLIHCTTGVARVLAVRQIQYSRQGLSRGIRRKSGGRVTPYSSSLMLGFLFFVKFCPISLAASTLELTSMKSCSSLQLKSELMLNHTSQKTCLLKLKEPQQYLNRPH